MTELAARPHRASGIRASRPLGGARLRRPGPIAATDPVLPGWWGVAILIFTTLTPFGGDTGAWPVIIGVTLLLLVGRRVALPRVRISLLVLPFVLWCGLSTLWSIEKGATASSVVLLGLSTGLGWLLTSGRSAERLLSLAATAVTTVLGLCWLAALVAPTVGFSQDDYDFGAFRGLLVQKNMMGYIAVFASVTLACAVLAERDRRRRWVRGLALAVAVFSVVATTSGTAVSVLAMMTLVGLGLAVLKRARAPRGLALTGLTLLIAVPIGFFATNPDIVTTALGKDPTLTGRTQIWDIVKGAIAQRPVLGYGWGALWRPGTPETEELWLQNHYPFYHAHNGYLDITAQVGGVGMALAALLLVGLLVRSARRFLAAPSSVRAWPVLVALLIPIYNATEVVGFRGVTWILLIATSTVGLERE